MRPPSFPLQIASARGTQDGLDFGISTFGSKAAVVCHRSAGGGGGGVGGGGGEGGGGGWGVRGVVVLSLFRPEFCYRPFGRWRRGAFAALTSLKCVRQRGDYAFAPQDAASFLFS